MICSKKTGNVIVFIEWFLLNVFLNGFSKFLTAVPVVCYDFVVILKR